MLMFIIRLMHNHVRLALFGKIVTCSVKCCFSPKITCKAYHVFFRTFLIR